MDSGAGGQNHFDCFIDAFSTITGAKTGKFPISYEEVDCEDSPLAVVVLDGPNANYVKVLVAGGKTGVQAVSLTLDGSKQYTMNKVVGATWAASLPDGLKDVSVQFEVTFDDGSTETAGNCFGGKWPVGIGSQCYGSTGSRKLLRGPSASS